MVRTIPTRGSLNQGSGFTSSSSSCTAPAPPCCSSCFSKRPRGAVLGPVLERVLANTVAVDGTKPRHVVLEHWSLLSRRLSLARGRAFDPRLDRPPVHVRGLSTPASRPTRVPTPHASAGAGGVPTGANVRVGHGNNASGRVGRDEARTQEPRRST